MQKYAKCNPTKQNSYHDNHQNNYNHNHNITNHTNNRKRKCHITPETLDRQAVAAGQ